MKLNTFVLMLFFVANFMLSQHIVLADNAQKYQDVIQQAEAIRMEADALTQQLRNMDPNQNMVGASSLFPSITEIVSGIESSITKLGELIDAAKKLTENTDSQITKTGETVRKSISDLTITMQNELVKLNDNLTILINSVNDTVKSTDMTIQTVNKTIQHVDDTTTKVINFIDSLGGRAGLSYATGESGLDASADVVLYSRGNPKGTLTPQYSYLRLTIDGVDNPDNRLFSAIAGTTKDNLSFGAGYIQDGFGLDIGMNEFKKYGFTGRLSLYRLRNVGVNGEIGYRIPTIQGTKVFLFGRDLLQENRSSGIGFGYEITF